MKKVYIILTSLVIAGGCFSQKNYSEYVPGFGTASFQHSTPPQVSAEGERAFWDIQLDVDPLTINTNLAGIYWTGTEFWVTKWNSDTLYTLDANGAVTGSPFTIPGITGARCVTSDGTYIYIGANTSSIYQVDMSSKTVVSTISTSVPNCRYVTYDPDLDGGSGGFWAGTWDTDFTAVSMSGATVGSIPASTHGLTGVYGLAYDPYTYGGPYLWAFDQGGTGGELVRMNMDGTSASWYHDTQSDLAGGNTGIAGGVCVTNSLVSGQVSICGISQGVSIFAYEISDPVGLEENESSMITVYPNPAKDRLNIQTDAQVNQIRILSIEGQLQLVEDSPVNAIDISTLSPGSYIVEIQTNEGVTNQQFIVE